MQQSNDHPSPDNMDKTPPSDLGNPYATPTADVETSGGEIAVYQSPVFLAKLLKWLFISFIAISVILFIYDWLFIGVLEGYDEGIVEYSTLESYEAFELASAGFAMLLLIALIAVYITWFHRSAKNIRALCPGDSEQFDFSPGWAIGAWFVPFLNLFRPYGIATEIYQATATKKEIAAATEHKDIDATRAKWTYVQPARIILGWWLMFVFGGFLDNAAARFYTKADDIDDFVLATQIDMVAIVWGIVGSALAIIVVKLLTDRQQKKAQEMSLLV